ncbi:hypothetical protein WICPIJ_002112 [Wickerhamomyces pijperi]|uniref:AAA+ ATPase domain-containing protein n=1 Tax=Wickerhamomyces pijperi TaxID=599730 RepID=A0A9P8QAA3_WICPI|nr:hypothetical protein WICPIJ_002112 [Wickerhamomyces pijperi]
MFKPTSRLLSSHLRVQIRPIISRTLRVNAIRQASTTVQKQLGILEQTANADQSNAEAQAEFYRNLLKANYPQYVVDRYEAPNIGTSSECADLYAQALKKLGRSSEAEQVALNASKGVFTTASGSNITGNATGSGGYGGMNSLNFGSRNEPIHVVITESTWTMVSKWLKWIIPLGLLTYGVMEGFNFLVENGTIFKNSEVSNKSVDMSTVTVKFDDVRGADEARAELEEIVDFLKDPTKFTGLGGKLPKGVLLTGPPGTGKTLLARATAGEAGVPFFFMSGSEFDELYVGVGAKRVRELFTQARAHSPAIIFIDELDAIGGKRNPKDQAYAKQTLNQLLVELDGFSQTSGIIIIGATNFPESLDKALTRPGRFDKIVNVDLPDVRGRADILKHHMKNVEIAKGVDPTLIARGTPGLSGAELMNLVNQAAVYASQQNALAVDMNHLEWAKDKILMGAARKTMVMTEATRRATAYHEAGHAIMALYTPGATSLYKATILPRGRALGITFQLPEMDKVDITKKECLARLDVCMGGKIAEEVTYGPENTTSGCGSDLSNATNTARAMVTSYGMSEKVGPIALADKWESWSAKLRDLADQEVLDLLKESENRTREMLKEKSVELERLAQGLIEYETLNKEEIIKICNGESIGKAKTMTNTVVDTPDSDDRRDQGKKQPFPVLAEA